MGEQVLIHYVYRFLYLQDPVALRLRHGALYGLPMALVAPCWAACYASSAAGLLAGMHGACLTTKARLLHPLAPPLRYDWNSCPLADTRLSAIGSHITEAVQPHVAMPGFLLATVTPACWSSCSGLPGAEGSCRRVHAAQVTFAALWGVHHMMHMLWGKVVVSMRPSLVSISMGAAVAALNFGLNFAFSKVRRYLDPSGLAAQAEHGLSLNCAGMWAKLWPIGAHHCVLLGVFKSGGPASALQLLLLLRQGETCLRPKSAESLCCGQLMLALRGDHLLRV